MIETRTTIAVVEDDLAVRTALQQLLRSAAFDTLTFASAEEFLSAGGKDLQYIPALNDHPAWLSAMSDITWANLAGWLGPSPSKAELALQADRAKALGATR